MLDIEWKKIEEFPTYSVSNTGLIKNSHSHILKNVKGSNGYYHVTLCVHNKKFTRSVHRLVAIAFIKNPNNYPLVNHIDENKLNNRADNLEWCTIKYNSNYGTSTSRLSNSMKRYTKKVGISKEIILYDVYSHSAYAFDSIRSASRYFNSSSRNISRMLKDTVDNKKGLTITKGNALLTPFYREKFTIEGINNRIDAIKNNYRIKRRIHAYKLESKWNKIYKSMNTASKDLGFAYQMISRVLKGIQKSTHGYTFKYEDYIAKVESIPSITYIRDEEK